MTDVVSRNGSQRWWDVATAVAAGAVAGFVYLATLLPGVGGTGDAAKFQFVGWALGTPHATGYPFLMLLSHAFTRALPVGTVAWRANVLSAVLAAAAVAVLAWIFRSGLSGSRWTAASAALVFAVGATWWSQAVIAEVYTLHGLLLVSLWALLIRWSVTRSPAVLAMAAMVVGLSLANHATTVTVLPAVALFLALERDHLRWRDLLCGLPAALVPGVLYLYPVWRTYQPTTTYLEMQTPNLATLWWYLTGAQFRPQMFSFSVGELVFDRVPMFAELMVRQVTVVGVGLAVVAVWTRRRSRYLGVMVLAFLGPAVHALCYDIPEIAVYFIPCWVILVVAVGLGAEGLGERLERRGSVIATVVLLVLAVGLAAAGWARIDRSDDRAHQRWVASVLAALPSEAVVIADDYTQYEVLQYVHQTGGTKGRELWILTPLVSPEDRRRIDELLERYDPPPFIRRQWVEAPGPGAVRAYLEESAMLWLKNERRAAPPGLPVFVTGSAQRRLLTRIGVKTTGAEGPVWRVVD